jgi:hypothetical protein
MLYRTSDLAHYLTTVMNVVVAGNEASGDKYTIFCVETNTNADPSGRSVLGVSLRPLASWDCGFESRLEHGCLSLVNVCCASKVVCEGRVLSNVCVFECDHVQH